MKKNYLILLTLTALFSLALVLVVSIANAQNINTIAGTGVNSFTGDGGNATAATLALPTDVAVDAAGNIYICDASNNRIRKISTTGIISTIAGQGTATYGGDNGPATSAYLNFPNAVALDASGNLYISDRLNNRIRKVDGSGTITTIAGTGVAGYAGDGGVATAAKLYYPDGLAVDAAGNIFFAEAKNNVVRKINTSGIIYTYAGTNVSGFSGDAGPSVIAQLNFPTDVALDATGNLYIADAANNRVRKVDLAGSIYTIAGSSSTPGFGGDGGPATAALFSFAQSVTTDAAGNIYVTDGINNRIRKISTTGYIYSVAGNGTSGFSGDGGPATAASFENLAGITKDAAGALYITDQHNNRIRKATPGSLSVSGTATVCLGNTITLAGSIPGGTWSSGTTATATVDSITGLITSVAVGTSIITYTESTVTATQTVSVTSCVGLFAANVKVEAEQVNIYPNPASNTVNIDIPANTIMLTVTDQLGRTVITKNNVAPAEQKLTIAIDNIPAGNYIIRAITTGTTYTNKLTIVK